MEFIERTKQTRRLQLSGGSTFIISLPKTWIENLKLKVGDSVTLVNNLNKSLSIVPSYESQIEIQKNEGIGIETIKQRLNLLYPDTHELIIDDLEPWFKVSLNIQLNNENQLHNSRR